MIISEISDVNDPVFLRLNDENGDLEIRFPKKFIDDLRGEWIGEIYFEGLSFDSTRLYKKTASEFITTIDKNAFNMLQNSFNWKIDDELFWVVNYMDDISGSEVLVSKTA